MNRCLNWTAETRKVQLTTARVSVSEEAASLYADRKGELVRHGRYTTDDQRLNRRQITAEQDS